MKQVTIDYSDYSEETNDPNERKTSRIDGPRYSDSEGYFRVPRTGFIRNEVEYTLRGFGKLDRRPGPRIEIPSEATEWFEKKLGHAYIPYFIRDRDLRLKISVLIKTIGWISLQRSIEETAKELPIVKAIHVAVNSTHVSVEPAGSQITNDDLENMFK